MVAPVRTGNCTFATGTLELCRHIGSNKFPVKDMGACCTVDDKFPGLESHKQVFYTTCRLGRHSGPGKTPAPSLLPVLR